jgi:predicted ATPase
MPEYSGHDFRSIELDPDLLATPFGVQTNWHVITGAPSCGKTTLINLLADKGFRTVQEGARQYMEREVARGRTIDEIHADAVALQRGIKDMQLNPNEFLRDCFHHRYASVFILDQLPLQLNGFRFNNVVNTGFFDALHAQDYCALGYNVIRVPVLPPEERFAFVLERISKQGPN